MADNKPALFPITAFIVSYHYARSAGLCVSRDTVYDLFIAAPTLDTQMNAAYVAFCSPLSTLSALQSSLDSPARESKCFILEKNIIGRVLLNKKKKKIIGGFEGICSSEL